MMGFLWATTIEDCQKLKKPLSLTIGNFDGVHRGHQHLIGRAVQWARENEGSALVLTFDPHPVQFLFPEKPHVRLFDLDDQNEQLRSQGVAGVFVQPFTADFSRLSPQQFLQDFLWKNFSPQHLVVGHDFSFGHSRAGNAFHLERFCAEKKISLEIVSALKIRGEVVSTTRIREALQAGDLSLVHELLGRDYYLKGIIKKGDQRGQSLGFPTANLLAQGGGVPREGVYASRLFWRGQQYKAVTNIGVNPTFVSESQYRMKIETHVLDENLNLYDELVRLEFVSYLRSEKKFSSKEDLIAQIQKDVAEARRRLNDGCF